MVSKKDGKRALQSFLISTTWNTLIPLLVYQYSDDMTHFLLQNVMKHSGSYSITNKWVSVLNSKGGPLGDNNGVFDNIV